MEKRINASLLLSFYGALLTDRQREALRLHYEDDLSLSELSEIMGVSRQGAHDAIRRGEARLESFEEAMGLQRRWERVLTGLSRAKDALCDKDIDAAKEIIESLLREEEA